MGKCDAQFRNSLEHWYSHHAGFPRIFWRDSLCRQYHDRQESVQSLQSLWGQESLQPMQPMQSLCGQESVQSLQPLCGQEKSVQSLQPLRGQNESLQSLQSLRGQEAEVVTTSAPD